VALPDVVVDVLELVVAGGSFTVMVCGVIDVPAESIAVIVSVVVGAPEPR
jgi:hypothetical protein